MNRGHYNRSVITPCTDYFASTHIVQYEPYTDEKTCAYRVNVCNQQKLIYTDFSKSFNALAQSDSARLVLK